MIEECFEIPWPTGEADLEGSRSIEESPLTEIEIDSRPRERASTTLCMAAGASY